MSHHALTRRAHREKRRAERRRCSFVDRRIAEIVRESVEPAQWTTPNLDVSQRMPLSAILDQPQKKRRRLASANAQWESMKRQAAASEDSTPSLESPWDNSKAFLFR